jgi:hypothetical protein
MVLPESIRASELLETTMARTKALAAFLFALIAFSAGLSAPAQAAPNDAAQVISIPLANTQFTIFSAEGYEVASLPFVSGELVLIVQQIPNPGAADRVLIRTSLSNAVASDGTYTCRLTGADQIEQSRHSRFRFLQTYNTLKATADCPFQGTVTTFIEFQLVDETAEGAELFGTGLHLNLTSA